SEPAYLLEDSPGERHVGPDGVAHGASFTRKTDVTAADDPPELGRQPAGRLGLPRRFDTASDPANRGVAAARGLERSQPTLTSLGIVVEECDNVARRLRHARVASTRQALGE